MVYLAHTSCKQVQMHTAFSTGHSLHRSVAQSGSSIQRNLVSCLTCAAFHSSEPNTFSETLLSAWYPPGCSCTPTYSFIQWNACLPLGSSEYP